jgi:hypothetical protein
MIPIKKDNNKRAEIIKIESRKTGGFAIEAEIACYLTLLIVIALFFMFLWVLAEKL